MQGLSLLKALGELDDWAAIYAVARSEIPLSSKVHQLALDLDNKEVSSVKLPALTLLCCAFHAVNLRAQMTQRMVTEGADNDLWKHMCAHCSLLQCVDWDTGPEEGFWGRCGTHRDPRISLGIFGSVCLYRHMSA